MAISSPGIGSNLDVNSIVQKLMQVESQPLATLAQKEASYQAKLSAFGTLSGALSSFQNALTALSTPAKFQAISSSSTDASIASVSTTERTTTGSYNIEVKQLARAQTLSSKGMASTSGAIGAGNATTLTFQFGSIGYGMSGTSLPASVASSGVAAGSLTINGSAIATSASTTSAKALAAQINLAKASTGVTATAMATDSGVLDFSDLSIEAGDNWSLEVDGVSIASLSGPASFSTADLDAALASDPIRNALSAQGISVKGSAADGTLRLTSAEGNNISLTQTLANTSGNATGGVAGLASGVATVYTGGVALSSDKDITVAGDNPALAGLAAGSAKLESGVYSNGLFTQDPTQATASITIDSKNNSLQGIRDAINKAGIGVTASIISDGSDTPYHLVLTSNKTGAKSSMKISVDGDNAIADLIGYDPAGTQNLTQTLDARNTVVTVNGITVNSATSTVSEAIQGTTINASKLGTTTVNISRDSAAVTGAVNSFVSAYNSLQSTISSLTAYNASTKTSGLLSGESAVLQIQATIRSALTTPLAGNGSALSNLTQIGMSFAKDGTMTMDAAKLQTAISNNFGDMASLFAKVANVSDSLVSYTGATDATRQGSYALSITRLATQGSVTGKVDLNAAPTVIAPGSAVTLTLDGNSARVPLTAGTYTASQLSAMLQSAINSVGTFSTAGSSVAASVDESGHLKLVSARYGSASTVSLGNEGQSAIAELLMGPIPWTSETGQDVAGTIGGHTANGSGQSLTGAAGTPVAGLKLSISGGALGDRGMVNYSAGYAVSIGAMIDGFIGSKGLIGANTQGLNDTIKRIDDQRQAFNLRLEEKQKRYFAQFTALDTAISSMNSTMNFLTQQLAKLDANTSD